MRVKEDIVVILAMKTLSGGYSILQSLVIYFSSYIYSENLLPMVFLVIWFPHKSCVLCILCSVLYFSVYLSRLSTVLVTTVFVCFLPDLIEIFICPRFILLQGA